MTAKKESITAKLCRIQGQLNAPKNQRNNFGKYNYRSCEDILEALKPLLSQEGCAIVMSDSITDIGGRIYVEACVSLFADGCDTPITVHAMAREPLAKKGMDEAQITGSVSSYARKYALNGLFAIDDCKDADTMDNRSNPEPPNINMQYDTKLGKGVPVSMTPTPKELRNTVQPSPEIVAPTVQASCDNKDEPTYDDGQYEPGAMYEHAKKTLSGYAKVYEIPKKPMNDWITGTFGKSLAKMQNDDGLLTDVLKAVKDQYLPTVGAVEIGGIAGKVVK